MARETIDRTGAHLIARAASFMLLADSRASFEIEGERPPRNRLERWGRAVVQAGRNRLTLDEIVRLHGVLIEDNRFVHLGLRTDGVFLGGRDHNGDPLPEFIGARPADLSDLMGGLIAASDRIRESELDPVLQATAAAFGFVYIHPLENGNGRLHGVLADRKFTPPGMVFPVSSVMLDRIDDYRHTLQSHSAPLMDFIKWRPTPSRNVEVLNDTADLYRYFDCTDAAEFLYACVARTVEHDLPREIDYLRRHDDAIRRIMDAVEMPDRLAENLLLFIRQNKGTLSKRRQIRSSRTYAMTRSSCLRGSFMMPSRGSSEPQTAVLCLQIKLWKEVTRPLTHQNQHSLSVHNAVNVAADLISKVAPACQASAECLYKPVVAFTTLCLGSGECRIR